jgi:hypothetical protein
VSVTFCVAQVLVGNEDQPHLVCIKAGVAKASKHLLAKESVHNGVCDEVHFGVMADLRDHIPSSAGQHVSLEQSAAHDDRAVHLSPEAMEIHAPCASLCSIGVSKAHTCPGGGLLSERSGLFLLFDRIYCGVADIILANCDGIHAAAAAAAAGGWLDVE